MTLGPAGDGGQREPAGDALGRGDQVGDDALVLAGEPGAGAAEAGLDLVGDEQDAVLAAELDERRQVARAGDDEAALALDGLDHDGGHVVGADLGADVVDGLGGGRSAARRRRRPASGRGTPSAPGRRRAANGPKPALYGIDLAVRAMVRLVRPW